MIQVKDKRNCFKNSDRHVSELLSPKKSDDDERQIYGRSTLASGTIPCLVVLPKDKNEMNEIVSLVNHIKWTIAVEPC